MVSFTSLGNISRLVLFCAYLHGYEIDNFLHVSFRLSQVYFLFMFSLYGLSTNLQSNRCTGRVNFLTSHWPKSSWDFMCVQEYSSKLKCLICDGRMPSIQECNWVCDRHEYSALSVRYTNMSIWFSLCTCKFLTGFWIISSVQLHVYIAPVAGSWMTF